MAATFVMEILHVKGGKVSHPKRVFIPLDYYDSSGELITDCTINNSKVKAIASTLTDYKYPVSENSLEQTYELTGTNASNCNFITALVRYEVE